MLCILGLGLWGCGDDDGPNGPAPIGDGGRGMTSMETESTTDPAGAEQDYVQPGPWASMDSAQRFEFMQRVVMTEMAPLFQRFDAQRFAQFSCGTCHGADGPANGFAMPGSVAPLDVADFPLTASTDPAVAAMATFMTEEVTPAMQALLDAEPWAPDNPTGFGCFGCHARIE